MRARWGIVTLIAALGVVILVARSSNPDSTSSRSVSTQQPQDEPREVDASPVDAGNAAQSEDGGVEAADAPPPAEPLRVCVVEGTSPVAGALIRHHDEEALAGTDGCATINATATVAALCATKGELIGCTHVERNAGVPWSIARISVARGSYLLVVVESPERTPIVGANVEVQRDLARFEGFTDDRGQLRLGPLPPATWSSTSVSARGWVRSAPRTPRLVAGSDTRLDVRLQPEAALSGVVVDPAGKATDWTRLVAVDPSSRLLFDAERVDGGQFRFEGLKPGQYDLEVSAEGFASSTQAATAPNERLKLILKQATRVFGTVVDEEDNALTASVFLVPLDSAGTRMNNRTLSTKNGAFAIDDASPGRYELCAALLDEKENPTATIKKTLDVRDSPVEVKLVFRRGEEIEGRIFDSAGAPLSEATVYAVPVGLSDLQGIDARIRVRAAVADPEGKFTIRFLEPGKYRFNAMERDSSRIQTHLAVAPAGTRGLRLEFRTGSLVKGQVVTPAGEPVQAYTVNGLPVNDQDGNFSGRFPEGPLVIEARGWPRVTRPLDSQQNKAQDLGVIRLQRAELISGQVVDRRTRQPILGVQLSAHSAEARASDADWDARFSLNSTASDSAGRFELATGEGPLRVRASHRGYLTSDVAVSTVRSLVIELDRGVEISGRVLDASGLPAQGVTVDAFSKDSVRDAKTDDDGRFRLSGLVAGDWRLGVHGWGVPYVPFSVPPTGLTNLTLKAPSKGVSVNVTLQGVLELDHMKAVLVPGQLVPPRTFLELFGVSSQGYVGESSRTGFQFLFVPPGDYTLFVAQIEFGGGDNSFYTVPLKVPNKSPAEFSLSPPAAVTFVFPGQR